jgi:DME family drug/metabolite transporter
MGVSMTVPAAARRRPGTGLLYLVASGLLWGTGGVTGSLLHRTTGLSAISVAAFRLTVGGVLIVVFLTVTGRRWPAGRAAWTRITVIGLLAALYQSCYFTAVSLTSVPLATLVTIGTAPVIVLGVERATGRSTSRLAVGASGLALVGLGLLVGVPSGFSETAVLAGAGMAVLAAAGFAAVTLTGSRPVPGLDDLTLTGFGFTLGGLALMPLAASIGGLSFRPGVPAFGLLIALGTGPTAVAYTLYFRGLRTVAASTAALMALLEPLTGAVLAAFTLGERLSGTGITGAAILAAAVILTVRADREDHRAAHRSRPRPECRHVLGRPVPDGGDQLTLTFGAQARTSRPVQALFAFPYQQVGQQFGPRAVLQPRGPGGFAAAGAEAFPARLGEPHRERFRAHPRSHLLLGQPRRIRLDDRSGVFACRTGLLDPAAERDHRPDRVVGSRCSGLGAGQEPCGQVTDVDHLRRDVRGGRHEHGSVPVACRARDPVTGAAGVIAGAADQPGSGDHQPVACRVS